MPFARHRGSIIANANILHSLPDANSFGSVGPYQAIFGLAVFYGGTAQFIAGIMEFRVGNTFGCTVHCSYGVSLSSSENPHGESSLLTL